MIEKCKEHDVVTCDCIFKSGMILLSKVGCENNFDRKHANGNIETNNKDFFNLYPRNVFLSYPWQHDAHLYLPMSQSYRQWKPFEYELPS